MFTEGPEGAIELGLGVAHSREAGRDCASRFDSQPARRRGLLACRISITVATFLGCRLQVRGSPSRSLSGFFVFSAQTSCTVKPSERSMVCRVP